MAFVNRFRLPFKLTRPQFLEERQTFRKTNGVIVVLSSIIRKQYEGETDNWPEKLHERFKIALAHDNVTIEGERYVGDVVQDGDYTINWSDFLDYPLAKATFKVLATPFNASNTNCGVCQDYIQVVAEDDYLPDLTEGQSIGFLPLDNDSICCDPATISIITTDSNYVESLEIIGNQINMVIKNPVATQNNVLLATYRVQCENGQYDEANIYANITGSLVTCFAPAQVIVNLVTSDSAHVIILVNILNPIPPDWEWELRIGFTVVQTGVSPTTTFDLTGLDPSTTYTIYVRGKCGEDDYSSYQSRTFTTDPPSQTESCGNYRLSANSLGGDPFGSASYYDCNGDEQFIPVPAFADRDICALQNSPGDPVYIQPSFGIAVTYLGLCP